MSPVMDVIVVSCWFCSYPVVAPPKQPVKCPQCGAEVSRG